MDILAKHITRPDIQTYGASNPLQEYITCAKEISSTKWVCQEGAYEQYCDDDKSYHYKVMKVVKVPTRFMKAKVFGFMYPDHTLVPSSA